MIGFVREHGLEVPWILETHVHADHPRRRYLGSSSQRRMPSAAASSSRMFGKIFNAGTEFQRDGSQFDRLFEDDDTFY